MAPSAATRTLAQPERHISIDAAAAAIGVSTATIRNWVKAGYLDPTATRPVLFKEDAVLSLKDRLSSGQIARLQSRANKSTSLSGTVPTEYAGNGNSARIAALIVKEAASSNLSISQALFITTFYILLSKGEISANVTTSFNETIRTCRWRRECVKTEMESWLSTFPFPTSCMSHEIVTLVGTVVADDFLGLLYQSLSSEGERSTSGSYYTPLPIVRDSLTVMTDHASSFLDPCCGTGQYLIQAASLLGVPTDRIYGFDIDKTAVKIARINMLLAFPDMQRKPNIEHRDFLNERSGSDLLSPANPIYDDVSFLATNPPWGSYKNARLADHLSNDVSSGEAFALFIAQSLRLLSEGAAMSFLLPESVLNIKVHADIRKLILEESIVQRIVKLGRQFSGVYTPVIRMDLIKGRLNNSNKIVIQDGGSVRHIDQDRFLSNALFVFDIDVTDDDGALLEHIYDRSHHSLRGCAEWALGIVTGNNKTLLSPREDKGMEEIYKGSDVYPFALGKAGNFIEFQPSQFQQVAKERFYRAPEKLIYKFISSRLVFAYDNKQRLTLNSANILIPNIPGMSIKTVMAFLNSDVYQYIFSTKFSTCKVLRGNLEALPFPSINSTSNATIEHFADLAIMGDSSAAAHINRLVYEELGFSKEQVSHVNRHLGRN